MSKIIGNLIGERRRTRGNRLFDLFILAGLAMNLIVVGWLVGYWALH